jgi:hypothetical protein
VFEGEPPATHAAALAALDDVMPLLEVDPPQAPSARIAAFIDALEQQWPGDTDEQLDASPWKVWPLTADAVGPLFYTSLTFSGAPEAVPEIARIAREHGLNCFDPQSERLL